MITIDLERTRELLREAMLTQGPDFVYNPGGKGSCSNIPIPDAPEGDPRRVTGCLVGTMFARLGVDMNPGAFAGASAVWVAGILQNQKRYHFTSEAVAHLARVQLLQDQGHSWGKALGE